MSLVVAAGVSPGAMSAGVVVNQVVLDDATRHALEQGYGVVLPPGRYW